MSLCNTSSARRLDVRASSEASPGISVLPPVQERSNRGQQPEQRVGQVDPDGVLHARDVTIALRTLVNIHLLSQNVSLQHFMQDAQGDTHTSEDAKDSDPQYEEDEVPNRGENACDAQNE